MIASGFEALAFGHDTAECAYYLQSKAGSGVDFERLSVLREEARAAKSKEPQVVALGGTEFLLEPNGSKSGYPFILEQSGVLDSMRPIQQSLVLREVSQ